MEKAPNNPEANAIGPGITEDQIRTAVEESGYPLQTSVARILRAVFADTLFIREEWSFVDRDTRELRALDLLASIAPDRQKQPQHVAPQLNLLIECKQSQLPYTFFLTENATPPSNFPVMTGLRKDTLSISSEDQGRTWEMPVQRVLGLVDDQHLAAPALSGSFSRCTRKGQKVELSGTDAYANLVLPLVKALHHFIELRAASTNDRFFRFHSALGIAVLDAPMIGVTATASGPRLELMPWVRVIRHEYIEHADWWKRERLWALDIVHKEFLVTFLAGHVFPFCKNFFSLVERHETELAECRGFISRLREDFISPLEPRLRKV